jgi:DNA/RNA endonuclease YhcR with UshA esterase domain
MKRLLTGLTLVLMLVAAACTKEQTPASQGVNQQASSASCSVSISWDEAINHVGDTVTVQGPVITTHYASTSNGSPTFLNVGLDYPDPDRFTVVIWGESRDSFSTPPEDAYAGKTICVTGTVQKYQGVSEIIVSNPSAILIT